VHGVSPVSQGLVCVSADREVLANERVGLSGLLFLLDRFAEKLLAELAAHHLRADATT